MQGFSEWIVDLNRNSHIWYGMVTVMTMSGMGILIAAVIEILFKFLGVKGKRIEIHH